MERKTKKDEELLIYRQQSNCRGLKDEIVKKMKQAEMV